MSNYQNSYNEEKEHEEIIAKKLVEHVEVYKMFSDHDSIGHAMEVYREIRRRK